MGNPDSPPPVAGLVIAGGKAERMGADKPFLRFGGGSLLDAVIGRVRPQVASLMLNVRPERMEACRARYGDAFALVDDAFGGEVGPLGGVVAGLRCLPPLGLTWLATFPCDTPFLPDDLVGRLWLAVEPGREVPIVAVAAGRVQSLCALWPAGCLGALTDGVASGALRGVWRALDALGAVRIEVAASAHQFFNINTPQDLAEAEKLAAEGR
jgi:molybdopterin-guanine dinucleotide biosynthesis protein A